MPSISKRSRTPEPAEGPPPGMTEFEAERQARISENQRRLAELMAGQDFGLLQKQQPASRPRPKAMPAKRRLADVPLEPQRRSSRIHNLPTPIYEVDIPDRRTPKRLKVAEGRRRSSVGQGEGGRGPVGTQRAYSGAYLLVVNYKGWESACGQASDAAASAARVAAGELVESLQQEGKAAFIKDMSGSQVSGGFWCQAPRALSDHWAHLTSVCEITVHCEDAVYPLASFAYNSEGERSWDMVWLPRPKSGAGFSGRWRAFAIDQRLHPNDTVVFEVVQERVLRAHLFRAFDYETDETRPGGQAPADWYAKALRRYLAGLDPNSPQEEEEEEEEEEEGQQQQEEEEELPQSSEGSQDVGGSDQQQARGRGAAVAAAGAAQSGSRPRVASRSSKKVVAGGLARAGSGDLAPSTPGALDAGVGEKDQGPWRGVAPGAAAAAAGSRGAGDMEVGGLAAAAEEGVGDDGSGTELPAAATGLPAAAPAMHKVPQLGRSRKPVPAAKKAGVAAAGCATKKVRSGGRRKGAAGGAAHAGPVTPPPRVGGAPAAASEGPGGGGVAAEEDTFYQLALQRAREEGLPLPTEEERRAAAGAAEFNVQAIMGFQVVEGQRQYLVRWHGFGPAWDLWSPEADLLYPPRTYLWSGSIPAGVPGASMRLSSGNKVRRR